MDVSESTDAFSIVVLGASGDLAKKKTFPALFELFAGGYLPKNTVIVGFARSPLSNESFRATIAKGLSGEGDKDAFLKMCVYFHGQYHVPEEWADMVNYLKEHEQKGQKSNRLFYLALPPSVFVPASQSISKAAMAPTGWTRIIVEKPFGRDSESSAQLSRGLKALFSEDQIYRIDHYLGKEMVLNVLVMRFANVAFSGFWNNQYISNVQITFKEDIGCEGRAGYFDHYGIIRDVMQNHLLQILTLVAMERPCSLKDSDIVDEKVKVLRQIAPLDMDNLVIGQYVATGDKPGYLDDPEVPKDSITPTFAATVFFINNDRWSGVPFILKCGKALGERKTEVRMQMRKVPGNIFGETPQDELVLRVQPNEAIYLKFMAKNPGIAMELVQTELDMSVKPRFCVDKLPDAYERLILDVLKGDKANFVRDDELAASWAIFTPLLHHLEKNKIKPLPYEWGSRGPNGADELAQRFGFNRYEGYEWHAC